MGSQRMAWQPAKVNHPQLYRMALLIPHKITSLSFIYKKVKIIHDCESLPQEIFHELKFIFMRSDLFCTKLIILVLSYIVYRWNVHILSLESNMFSLKTNKQKNCNQKHPNQNKATLIFLVSFFVFLKKLKKHLIHTVTRMYFHNINHKGKLFCGQMIWITSEIN